MVRLPVNRPPQPGLRPELVQALPPDPEGVAILNFDDPWVRKMEEKTKARVFFYGLSPEAHLLADQVTGLGLDGIRFRMHYAGETLHVKIPLIGRHSVHTALRAAAVGLAEGMNWQEILEGLNQGHTTPPGCRAHPKWRVAVGRYL